MLDGGDAGLCGEFDTRRAVAMCGNRELVVVGGGDDPGQCRQIELRLQGR